MSTPQLSVFASDDAYYLMREDPDDPTDVDFYWQMRTGSPIRGRFEITSGAEVMLHNLEPQEWARFGTLFLELEAAGNRPRSITEELIEQAISRMPLPVIERAERLLRFLHEETSQVGERLEYVHGDPRLLLYSESTDDSEIRFLLEFMEEQGLVTNDPVFGTFCTTLTVHGFVHIAEQYAAPDSSQAFVAMWFDESMDALYSDGIDPGVRDAGYVPLRVDRQPSLHRIDDQIIAEIRRSRFMVADFTQGGSGARGSVYYEAGFAHGLGLPVIFTCRSDHLDKLHFDIRQYPHIGWTEPAELREQLRYRVEALIGQGPRTVG